jgi:hopanoid biosynthesis associated RND transporter like protein HpnN
MLGSLLKRWTTFIANHPATILSALGLLTCVAAYYAVSAFSMNSDTSRLIHQDTAWKRAHTEFITTFPQYDQNTFVVVSGEKPGVVSSVAEALAESIRTRQDVFKTIYHPGSGQFADDHALLFMSPENLNNTVSKLADAQPFLTAVAQDDSLRSVFELLLDAVESEESLSAGFLQMTDVLNLAVGRALEVNPAPIGWRDELFRTNSDESNYQVIFVQGQQNFGQDLPNAMIINTLEQTIEAFAHPYKGKVDIRLTGQVPLEHGEIVSAMESAQFAGTLALFILIVVLVWGVKSARIIAAIYLSMLCGLIWTAAFAMATVGQFNTISIIFLVMFIGLGVDFAVHLCLRFQEARSAGSKTSALLDTAEDLGPAIILCGITSAIGFLAFVPTNYIGLAEMGIISGGGMIIAVVISLTLIPAFFAVTGDPQPASDLPFAELLSKTTAARPGLTAYTTLGIALVLAVIASRASFDYSTLALKDPESEAMVTLRELHEQDIVTDYALTFIADDLDSAISLKQQLLKLDVVSEVKTPLDHLPQEQDEKLFILEDARFLLDSLFAPSVSSKPFPDEEQVVMLNKLIHSIDEKLTRFSESGELSVSIQQLREQLTRLANAEPAARHRLQLLTITPLKQEIAWLTNALTSKGVRLDDLPPEMRDRLLADAQNKRSRTVVSITPKYDLLPVEAMQEFTLAVSELIPNITGRPVLDLGIGEIVIVAFKTAIGLAVITIFCILLMTLRSVVDSVLVFIPLAMTALATLAFSVAVDLPLNMANVVVIPLIFGLGVDNGIHIVKRFHQVASLEALVHSSTPKAVFLSNLTTLGTFCALIFSTHQGIYSIGVLLTVALTTLMLLTLISLPALLATFSRPQYAT